MSSGNKVIKYRKRRGFNVGVFTFLIIFIYVFISVCIYFTKDHLTIYEVKEGSTSDDYIFTGLIFRDEVIVSSNTAGYISYYHRDGDRISKNSTIYSIDENKSSYDLIDSSDDSTSLSADDSSNIKKDISNFQKKYNDSNYQTVYDFKYNIQNTVLEIVNDKKLSNLETALDENGTSNTLKVVKSDSSGIITYYKDDMESLTLDTVAAANFDNKDYKKTQLRTNDLIKKNTPVYKLVKSDDWSILLLLDKSQYEKLAELKSAKVTFSDDGLEATLPVNVYQKGNDYFARIDLDKYMIQFINERYIKLEIAVNAAKGLKIPVTSIVEKDFYQIPQEYFTKGGDSDSMGLGKETINDKGETEYTFVAADIYSEDDDYGYVDTRLFNAGDTIRSEDEKDTFQIGKTKSLKGVYNVNKGYAVFRYIEILYKNEEYCIIKKGTEYGLSVYDHIALDSKTATEQEIIY